MLLLPACSRSVEPTILLYCKAVGTAYSSKASVAAMHLTTALIAASFNEVSTDVVPRRWGLAQRPMTRFLLAAGVHLGGYV